MIEGAETPDRLPDLILYIKRRGIAARDEITIRDQGEKHQRSDRHRDSIRERAKEEGMCAVDCEPVSVCGQW